MADTEPTVELHPGFSDPRAQPTPWDEACRCLIDAGVSWLSTVRADGRPHVTPLMTVFVDDALYFCTGPREQKATNLARNPHCSLTTGANALREGLDVVVEGEARRVSDDAKLQPIADAYVTKYGSDWHYIVRDGEFHHGAGEAWVFELSPKLAFAFHKDPYGQTRYRFADGKG